MPHSDKPEYYGKSSGATTAYVETSQSQTSYYHDIPPILQRFKHTRYAYDNGSWTNVPMGPSSQELEPFFPAPKLKIRKSKPSYPSPKSDKKKLFRPRDNLYLVLQNIDRGIGEWCVVRVARKLPGCSYIHLFELDYGSPNDHSAQRAEYTPFEIKHSEHHVGAIDLWNIISDPSRHKQKIPKNLGEMKDILHVGRFDNADDSNIFMTTMNNLTIDFKHEKWNKEKPKATAMSDIFVDKALKTFAAAIKEFVAEKRVKRRAVIKDAIFVHEREKNKALELDEDANYISIAKWDEEGSLPKMKRHRQIPPQPEVPSDSNFPITDELYMVERSCKEFDLWSLVRVAWTKPRLAFYSSYQVGNIPNDINKKRLIYDMHWLVYDPEPSVPIKQLLKDFFRDNTVTRIVQFGGQTSRCEEGVTALDEVFESVLENRAIDCRPHQEKLKRRLSEIKEKYKNKKEREMAEGTAKRETEYNISVDVIMEAIDLVLADKYGRGLDIVPKDTSIKEKEED